MYYLKKINSKNIAGYESNIVKGHKNILSMHPKAVK